MFGDYDVWWQILNTREPIFLDSGYNSIETYNSICQSIAHQILADNFPAAAQNIDTVNHLANYLQKTFFFRSLQPYVDQKSFDYMIEILHNEQIFYKKVTLSIVAIAQIVFRAINTHFLQTGRSLLAIFGQKEDVQTHTFPLGP